MNLGKGVSTTLVTAVLAFSTANSHAAEDAGSDNAAELAKKLANPIAALISVRLQSCFAER